MLQRLQCKTAVSSVLFGDTPSLKTTHARLLHGPAAFFLCFPSFAGPPAGCRTRPAGLREPIQGASGTLPDPGCEVATCLYDKQGFFIELLRQACGLVSLNLQDELYMEGVAYLVEVLYLRKMFTK
eukprot:1098690-Pelagomonas_calceolata.AAC.1